MAESSSSNSNGNNREKLLLCFRATLWECTNLELKGGFDDSRHKYMIKLRCNGCHGEREVSVRNSFSLPIVPSRDFPFPAEWPDDLHVNYQDGCKKCSTPIWVKMIRGHGEPFAPSSMFTMMCDDDYYGKMMLFEVYGVTPCGYKFGEQWQAKSKSSGEIIQDIDLSSGFWSEELDDEGSDERACIIGAEAFFKPFA